MIVPNYELFQAGLLAYVILSGCLHFMKAVKLSSSDKHTERIEAGINFMASIIMLVFSGIVLFG